MIDDDMYLIIEAVMGYRPDNNITSNVYYTH